MPNLSKTLDISSATARVVTVNCKSPSNYIRYNCKEICSWSRRPKTILGIRKKGTFLWVIKNSIIYKFFNNYRKKTDRVVAFSYRPFHNILKCKDYWWNLLTIWKRRILQTLIDWRVQLVCKKVQSHKFFRATTEIQSGPDTFDKLSFFMTLSNILGVTEILCSFRLVWEGKICRDTWVIKIRVLRKDFSKQLCFIRCRRQHLQPAE